MIKWDPSFGLAKSYRVEFSDSSSFSRSFDSQRLENTAYARTLSSGSFAGGGSKLWRVAAIDEGGNVGAWASGRIGLLRRMVVTTSGLLHRGRPGLLEVRVRDIRGRGLRRARVSIRGAGVRAGSRRTSRRGIVRFRVRPRVSGRITVRADKRGFRPGSATLSVG